MHYNNENEFATRAHQQFVTPRQTQSVADDVFKTNITSNNKNSKNNTQHQLTYPPMHALSPATTGSCTSSTDSGVIGSDIEPCRAGNEEQQPPPPPPPQPPFEKLNNVKCHNSERLPTDTSSTYNLENIRNIGKITVTNSTDVKCHDNALDREKHVPADDDLTIIKHKNQKNVDYPAAASNDWRSTYMYNMDKDTATDEQDRHRAMTSKTSSPSISVRSTSISIVSINENAEDSSIVDSDSEFEADAEGVHSKYIVRKLGQQSTYGPNSDEVTNLHRGLKVIGQRVSPVAGGETAATTPSNILSTMTENILNAGASTQMQLQRQQQQQQAIPPPSSSAQIASIEVTNSGFTIGDKYIYQAPVTIQQFLIDSGDKTKPDGHENPAYVPDPTKPTNTDGGSQKVGPPTAPTDQAYRLLTTRKAVIATAVIVLLTIICGIVFATTNSLYKSTTRKNKDNIGAGKVLRMVARDGWLAQPAQKIPIKLQLPVDKVILISTQTDLCSTQAACTYRVRFIQTYNIESLQHDDIIYNFLIGGDGNVYEGRGWDNVGAHLKGYNENSVSFAFIGTFKHQRPNAKQLNVTKLLLDEGRRLEKLAPHYKIYGANTFDPTGIATSADGLYDSFKNWPHWSDS